MKNIRSIKSRSIAGALLGLVMLPFAAFSEAEVHVKDGKAVSGYDVVAYFTEGKPVEGNGAFTASHNGAEYQFSSAENRDLFSANPDAYAPQYGGYCAFGTAMGRKFDGDPNAWHIADNKLYLNLNKNIQERWIADVPGFVKGANNNWPIIQSLSDATLESNPPEGLTAGAL